MRNRAADEFTKYTSRTLLLFLVTPWALLAQARTDRNAVLENLDLSIDQVAQRAAPAVVQVLVSGLAQSLRQGEGVIEHQRKFVCFEME